MTVQRCFPSLWCHAAASICLYHTLATERTKHHQCSECSDSFPVNVGGRKPISGKSALKNGPAVGRRQQPVLRRPGRRRQRRRGWRRRRGPRAAFGTPQERCLQKRGRLPYQTAAGPGQWKVSVLQMAKYRVGRLYRIVNLIHFGAQNYFKTPCPFSEIPIRRVV